jgi:F-box domain
MQLPHEIIRDILGRLSGPDLVQCRLVCHLWRQLAPIKAIWVTNGAKIGHWAKSAQCVTYKASSGPLFALEVPDIRPLRPKLLTVLTTEYSKSDIIPFYKFNREALVTIGVLKTNYMIDYSDMATYFPNVTELIIDGPLIGDRSVNDYLLVEYCKYRSTIKTIKGLDRTLYGEVIKQLRQVGMKVIESLSGYGGVFGLIANDGKVDRMLMATMSLNQRLKDIEVKYGAAHVA